MRFMKLVPALLLVMWSGAASAQAWIEYDNEEWRFGANFPSEPTAEEVEWITEDDHPVPAIRFSASRGDNTYNVIIADYREARLTTMLGSEAHAATQYRKLGEVTLDSYSQIDRVGGLQIQITKPDMRRLFLAIHIHEGFLYIGEADVAPRSAPPGQFQQSLHFLGEDGVRVRYLPTGEQLVSTDGLDIDPDLITDRSLYVEDGFVTRAQYQELLQAAN